MRAVVGRWSHLGFGARLVLLAGAGLGWAVSSLHGVLFNPDYWDPITASDYFAVYAYTAAFLLLASALLVLREVAEAGAALRPTILVVAIGSATAGIANALEDGLGVRGFGSIYVLGYMVAGLGLLILAPMIRIGSTGRLAFVPLVGGIALITSVLGGGVLALVAWLGFGAILVRERREPHERPARSL